MLCHTGPHEEIPKSIRRQRGQERVAGGRAQAKAFIGVSQGKARQSRINSSGLASLNHFRRLLAIGVVCSCLAPAPGTTKAEEYCLLGYTGQIEEDGSDLVVCI